MTYADRIEWRFSQYCILVTVVGWWIQYYLFGFKLSRYFCVPWYTKRYIGTGYILDYKPKEGTHKLQNLILRLANQIDRWSTFILEPTSPFRVPCLAIWIVPTISVGHTRLGDLLNDLTKTGGLICITLTMYLFLYARAYTQIRFARIEVLASKYSKMIMFSKNNYFLRLSLDHLGKYGKVDISGQHRVNLYK